MKFTLSWLKDHLEFNNSLEDICEALVKMGIEIEAVENYQEKYKAFSVGYIKSAEKHPDADKLRVCKVDTIDGELQIVCGAPNARAGIYVIYAPVGSYIPAIDVTLKATKIRGIDSLGMMTSMRELDLGEDHDGIIEFQSGVVGMKACEKLGLNDIIIDVSITPNRGDMLGVRGIAKDLAGFGIGKLKPLNFKIVPNVGQSDIEIKLDKEVSKKFLATKITGVKNVESPDWLKQKLKMIGQESRGSLVDIPNFICFDMNQPMHAYDLSKLQTNPADKTTISVELSNASVKYIALDEKEYTLSEISPIVKINNKIGAIAGIKGSLDTCCDEHTTSIMLECAHFDNKIVALAKRELGINTESAYRYEREIDFKAMNDAFDYAVYLITSICGGVVEGLVTQEHKYEERKISFGLDYINQLSGVIFSSIQITEILEKLGFKVNVNADFFEVIPPSRRNDIDDKSVVVAEIIRMYGADNLPKVEILKNSKNTNRSYDYTYGRALNSRKYLAKLGLQEVVSMSFISNELADLFGIMSEDLTLQNPISVELSVMRKSLIPSLMLLAEDNINRSYSNLRLFEVANIYANSSSQEVAASAILVGNSIMESWNNKTKNYDVWDMKAIAYSLITDLGYNPENMNITQENLPKYYHPYKSASIHMGKNIIGYFGEIHPKVLDQMGIKTNIMASEIFINRLPDFKFKGFAKQPVVMSEFMPIKRDFAFIVDKNVTAGEIIRLVKSVDKKIITDVNVFDIFEGASIEEGKKSVAITVTLQSFEKTFIDEEILDLSAGIVASLAKGLNAKLRDAK